MADGITGELIGGREVVVRLEHFTPRVRQNVRDAITRMQTTLQRLIKSHLRGGNPLHIRSGKLAESVTIRPIEETAGEIRGPVGTNTIYGPIQEHGGTITPKNAQFLTIPLEAALTAAKVLRFTARQIIDNPSEGGFEGTFFRNNVLYGVLLSRQFSGERSKKNQGGLQSNIIPLFALKTSVTLPARPFMAPALEAVRDPFVAALERAVAKAME